MAATDVLTHFLSNAADLVRSARTTPELPKIPVPVAFMTDAERDDVLKRTAESPSFADFHNTLHITDSPEFVNTKGKPRNTITGDYDPDVIRAIASQAHKMGRDPYLPLAVLLKESGMGHVPDKEGLPIDFANNRVEQNPLAALDQPSHKGLTLPEAAALQTARFFASLGEIRRTSPQSVRQRNKDSALQIQAYNGLNNVSFNRNKYYQPQDIGKTLNMREHPRYGERIIQLMQVLRNNPDVAKIVSDARAFPATGPADRVTPRVLGSLATDLSNKQKGF